MPYKIRWHFKETEGPFQYFGFGAVSKSCAVLLTYPFQVMRTRLQDQYNLPEASRVYFGGLGDAFKKTWLLEGWRGLYRGFGPHIAKALPQSGLTFLLIESARNLLKG